LLLILSFLTLSLADQYAVIAVGSNGYYNYRHQADACHAYQVLVNHNIPKSNIIMMSYDDVPNALQNPFPGKLFNAPGNHSADVNEGCIKDYTGADVTAKHFLNIIQGEELAMIGVGTGRVLKSGPNDHVFIYFVDHGASGVLSFPNTWLYNYQLIDAFTEMKAKGMYSQLTIYIEACYSGSMFDGVLKGNLNVYAVTAANATESSWGAYCPYEDFIDGIELDACLGDLFSVNWLENSDSANLTIETLDQQFDIAQTLTNLSHVSRFGNFSFVNETVDEFLGNSSDSLNFAGYEKSSNWESTEIKLNYLLHMYTKYQDPQYMEAILEELEYRDKISGIFAQLASNLETKYDADLMNSELKPLNTRCLEKNMMSFEQHCGIIKDYGLKYIQVLVNICEVGISNVETDSSLKEICSP